MKILVTGATGFLGRHVVPRLKKVGHDVIPLPKCNLRDGVPEVTAYTASVDRSRLLGNRYKPDVIVHLAAHCGGIGYNRENPYDLIRDNLLINTHVLEHAVETGAKFVTVGSVCAYPEVPAHMPFQEIDLHFGAPEPTNAAYGHAKRILLDQCWAARSQHGLSYTYLILANMYGPGDHFGEAKGHVIPDLIDRFGKAVAAGEKTVELWGDGKPTRDFLFVEDAARAIQLAVERDITTGSINIGTSRETSIRNLALKIAELQGFEGNIVWDATKPNGQPRRCLNIARAWEHLGWDATTHIDDGLRMTVDWWKANCA